MIDEIKIEPYKSHKGETRQYSYKGIALTPIEHEIILKLNELIRQHNQGGRL